MGMRRGLGIVIVVVGLIAAACSDGGGTEIDARGSAPTTSTSTTDTSEPTTSTTSTPSPTILAEPSSTGGDPKIAGAAITRFGNQLFGAIRDPSTNIVVSPVSVAIALAMLEPGATGDAKSQLDAALHTDDPTAFHASMTALRRHLVSAKATPANVGDKPGDLQIAIANAAYMQAGYPIRPTYAEALSRYYGPLLRVVDFRQQQAVADAINAFVRDGTHGHINKIIDKLSPDTVLALVNALFLKASWAEPFDASATKPQSFTRLDSSTLSVSMMHGTTYKSMKGDGWVAGAKAYTGSLSVDFVLPDAGRFDEVAGEFPAVFDEFAKHASGGSAQLAVPRFTTRFMSELRPAFAKLGIAAPYSEGHLLGIADDRSLVLDQAVHATFLTMDETGTEAAAATIVSARTTSAPVSPPPPVILDRPFFFRIMDNDTGVTLFIGQVLDPTE